MINSINNKKKIGIGIIIILSLLCINQLSLIIFNNTGLRDVAVTTNAKSYDDFDKWLTKTIGIKAVPCHIFIKNGKVVNYVDYTVFNREFTKISKTKKYDYDLWEKDLEDINGNKINLRDYDVIYVAKANCKACNAQNRAEPSIQNKHGNLNLLTYYIKTDKSEVDCSQGCD